MVARSDDLIPLLVPPVAGKGLSFAQGVLLSWDPDTFENTVNWKDITLTNVPVLPSVDALSFEGGIVVGMLGWNPGGGAGSWWILGRINVPPIDEPPSIKGGNLNIDGGDVVVSGDGEIRSEDFDGNTADEDPGTTGWALGNNLLALAGAFVPVVDALSDDVRTAGFTINTTDSAKASVTIPVPVWAETASVVTTSLFALVNNSGGSVQVTMKPRIAGDDGFSITLTYAAGAFGVETIAHSRTFDVSAMSNFTVEARMFTTAGSFTSASNGASVSTLIMFRSPQ